jgi:hypothetical protein
MIKLKMGGAAKLQKPCVAPGDWIHIGDMDAVVCQVFQDGPNDIEVVFLDKGEAVKKDAKWTTDRWELDTDRNYGGYADIYSRLSYFVSILREGTQFYAGK